MRLSKYLLGCLALLFLLPACKTAEEVEEATLELSTKTLAFAKDGGEQTVTVSTNKESYMAFSTQEAWLSVEQQGETMKVKATANDQGRDRVASVIVSAGGLQQRIAVKQSAADVLLELDEAAVSFAAMGGEKKIAYSSNGTKAKIELATPVDWLTIDKVTATSFVLKAKESTDKHRRQVKVILTSGTTIREIEVSQEGTQQYVLPLLKMPVSLGEVLSYERGRGHYMLKSPDGLLNKDTYRFLTQSKAMPYVEYVFSDEQAQGYKKATTVCRDVTMVKDNADFEDFMREQGFEKANTAQDGSYITYHSKTIPLEVRLTIQKEGVVITVLYLPVQTQKYPTFAELPLKDQIPFLGSRDLQIMGKKRDDVHEAEKKWGGQLDNAVSKGALELYKVDDSFSRLYFFIVASDKEPVIPKDDPYIDVCEEIQGLYTNVNLALWQDPLGSMHPTIEFLKLVISNDYSYLGTAKSGAQLFLNEKEERGLAVKVLQLNGKPTLSIGFFRFRKKKNSGATSIATLLDYRSSLKAQQAEREELRRLESIVDKHRPRR
ncbi:BACON domain-containing protein [Porphyromonas sp.]